MASKSFQLNLKTDRSFELSGTINSSEIATFKTQALTKLQKQLNLSGFRPGKVPLHLVASNYDEATILSEAVNLGLTSVYRRLVDEFELKPIVPPTLDFKTPPTLATDWQVTFTSCLEPELTLNPAYFTALKKLPKLPDRQKNIDAIMALIEKNSQLVLPEPLVAHEWEHYQEEHPVDPSQAKDQKAQYSAQLKSQWLLNLALNQIGRDHKLNLTADDLKNVNLPPELVRSNPQLAVHLLLQDKIVNFLIENIGQA